MRKENHHIDPNKVQKYLNNEMTDKERHLFEKEMLESEFDLEAMEGLETVSSSEFSSDLSDLNKEIQKKTKTAVKFPYLKIAAALVLIFTFSYLLTTWIKNNDPLTNPSKEIVSKEKSIERDTLSAEADSVSLAIQQNEQQKPDTSVNTLAFEPEITKEEQKALEPVVAEEPPAEAIALNEVESKSFDEELVATEEDLTEKVKTEVPQSLQESLSGRVAGVEVKTDNNITERARKVEESALEEVVAAPSKKSALPSVAEPKADDSETKTISGIVLSSEDNTPIVGATIIEKNTANGASSGIDGRFYLDVSPLSQDIMVSFIGYNTEEISILNKEEFTIVMEPDISQLSEIVVTGYSTNRNDTEVVVNPRPLEGYREFNKYIKDNLTYPQEAIKNNIKGRVVVEFTVTEEGDLQNFQVIKSLGYGCDEEAIRLLENGPEWEPGTVNGYYTDDRVKMTIKFKK